MHRQFIQGYRKLNTAYLSIFLCVTVPGVSICGVDAAMPHLQVVCSGCHQRDEATGDPCRRCHALQDVDLEGVSQAFHADPTRGCTDCHSFHHPDTLNAGSDRFAFDFDNEALLDHCAGCHGAGLNLATISTGHQAARELYHSGSDLLARLSPSEACLTCHSRGAVLQQASLITERFPQFNEHGSHPYGVAVIPGMGRRSSQIRQELDPRIVLLSGRIECRTCHDLTNSDDDRLVRFETKYALCQGCHEQGSQRRTLADHAPATGSHDPSLAANEPR